MDSVDRLFDYSYLLFGNIVRQKKKIVRFCLSRAYNLRVLIHRLVVGRVASRLDTFRVRSPFLYHIGINRQKK